MTMGGVQTLVVCLISVPLLCAEEPSAIDEALKNSPDPAIRERQRSSPSVGKSPTREEIELAVEHSVREGLLVAVVSVESAGTIAGFGPPCLVCSWRADNKVLNVGYKKEWTENDAITLSPIPSVDKIILLMHSKGNWIEYKKEYEDMIQKKVDSIRSKNMVDEKEKTVGDQRPAPPSDSK